ncbi:unnamed protein product [Paramecium octaurelia]|uniref:Transmembrane protein n=1 Tax=Paramecium octaurelia TaxID=43137 RepID=A0A8S1TRA3_PAROT|nr:unnamed protein product [Paramecium octaurelia]
MEQSHNPKNPIDLKNHRTEIQQGCNILLKQFKNFQFSYNIVAIQQRFLKYAEQNQRYQQLQVDSNKNSNKEKDDVGTIIIIISIIYIYKNIYKNIYFDFFLINKEEINSIYDHYLIKGKSPKMDLHALKIVFQTSHPFSLFIFYLMIIYGLKIPQEMKSFSYRPITNYGTQCIFNRSLYIIIKMRLLINLDQICLD